MALEWFCYSSFRICLILAGAAFDFPSAVSQCEANDNLSSKPIFLANQPQTLKQWHRTISHNKPGRPLMTHQPSKPIEGACMTVAQMLFYIFIISKKFKTIATPILEKLTVANINDAPSDYLQQSPQRLANLSRKSEQFDMQMMKAMTMKTHILMTWMLSMRSRQASREESLVRNTWVSLIRTSKEPMPITTEKILLKRCRILQYHISLIGFVFFARDLKGVCVQIASIMSQQKSACLTQSALAFYCLRHLAIERFMSRLCQIAFYSETGYAKKQPVVLRTVQQWALTDFLSCWGIISSDAWQYLPISSSVLVLLTQLTQLATFLNQLILQSTSSSVSITLLQRQSRQSFGLAFLHMVLGTYTKAYPIRTMRRIIPQIVAKHFKKVMRPIYPPALSRMRMMRKITAPTIIARQKMPFDLRLLLRRSLLSKSPASYHSWRTGIMVQVSRQTDQYKTRYCIPRYILISLLVCPIRV